MDGRGQRLPDDPTWMQRALGLSDSLIADLLSWLHDADEAAQHTLRSLTWPRRRSDLQAVCVPKSSLGSGPDSTADGPLMPLDMHGQAGSTYSGAGSP